MKVGTSLYEAIVIIWLSLFSSALRSKTTLTRVGVDDFPCFQINEFSSWSTLTVSVPIKFWPAFTISLIARWARILRRLLWTSLLIWTVVAILAGVSSLFEKRGMKKGYQKPPKPFSLTSVPQIH